MDIEVPATIGGTFGSWRLEDTDDRCRISEEFMESESAVFVSRIFWNRERAAEVLRFAESNMVEFPGDNKSFR